jgi:quercetin dioxygenase-like cupin family protein
VSAPEVRELLDAEGIDVSAWSNGPFDRYAEHRHAYDKVLVATEGAITFHLTELGRHVLLRATDRLHLPAGTLHGADVGADGVTCLEGHLPAGSLGLTVEHVPSWAVAGRTDAGS